MQIKYLNINLLEIFLMKIQEDIYMSVIETKNLTKSYGKSRGIIDVNLNIEDG
jgi:hypothetical protein